MMSTESTADMSSHQMCCSLEMVTAIELKTRQVGEYQVAREAQWETADRRASCESEGVLATWTNQSRKRTDLSNARADHVRKDHNRHNS
eukprot:CAMPEP_0171491436 /NCGR_PEP_ID=MMETSP0958-20121227/3860_1 /TAXON_ID=87120 /ORGANISM="Aurantiochytrium limacinum, Strain ATCCMYA-1381" /LENGTH=88 /DNA_ID=CAMNT_0012024857 /DNA_START=460 /DNA_END=727 /DNA_ORIENTATION=+